MRVWIDCSNSPHPLLFAPVARELEERGHEVVVTARDHAQTVELARAHWPDAEVLDGLRVSWRRAGTSVELIARTAALLRWAREARPQVALGHNSYAQIVAARAAKIPVVTAMDYEYQPANHLAFRLADRILLPEALPADVVERQGAAPAKVRRYHGLKEELYVGDFAPDHDILARLGIRRADRHTIVVARSGATRAAYHDYEDALFSAALGRLAGRDEVTVVVLARHPEHRRGLALDAHNFVVPENALDGRSLLHEADLFIGAGGTMTREAALLGVPTLSVFGGEEGAVDRLLAERGLLRRLRDVSELDELGPRPGGRSVLEDLRVRGRVLSQLFAEETLATAARRWA